MRKKKIGIHYYANDNNFSKHNNIFPEDKINKIIVGDSENILKNYPDNCIDLIVTSPPYNFNQDYDVYKDANDFNFYFNKLFAIFDECIRILKYGGRIIVNIQPVFSYYVPTHHIISNYFMNKKMIWKGEIIWDKQHYNCKTSVFGSWNSPSSPYLKYTWEFIEIFCKGTLKHSGKKEDIDIVKSEFRPWLNAKWSIKPETKMKKYGHPAMFPEELVERILKLFSYKNDIILDPFNGAGTTTYVSHKLNRKYIGIDISEQYCEIAQKRIDEYEQRLFL